MKLLYVCECCDEVVHSLELETPAQGEIPPALTGIEPQNIINMSSNGEQVTVTTLCAECLEDMYGMPESSYFSGPVLN